MTACACQPAKSTVVKALPCSSVKPIYIPEGLDKETEDAIIDFDIAFDKSCGDN